MTKKILLITILFLFSITGKTMAAPPKPDIVNHVGKSNNALPPSNSVTPEQISILDDWPFGAHGNAMDYDFQSEMGIGWKRMDSDDGLVWDHIEPAYDGNYYWEHLDDVFQSAAENNIKLFVTIVGLNQNDAATCREPDLIDDPYGLEYSRKLPCDLDKYKNFLSTAVNRYGDSIVYQLDNEIAAGNFWTDTAENYALFLKESYVTIKNTCPTCVVAMGSATKSDINYDYFTTIFAELAKYEECSDTGCYDLLDVHDLLYDPDMIALDKDTRKEVYEFFVDLQNAHGYNKPIWSTEVGFLERDLEWNEKALTKTYVTGLHMGIDKLFWRICEDCCAVTTNNTPRHLDGEKTATYYAYKTVIDKLGGYSDINMITETQYEFAFAYKSSIYVLWCNDNSCPLPEKIRGDIIVTDYLGNVEYISADELRPGTLPVFVEVPESDTPDQPASLFLEGIFLLLLN